MQLNKTESGTLVRAGKRGEMRKTYRVPPFLGDVPMFTIQGDVYPVFLLFTAHRFVNIIVWLSFQVVGWL